MFVERVHKRYEAFRIKEEICKKQVQRHKKRCGGSERKSIDRNEERFRQLSDKVDKNKMADAEMATELHWCRQEKKEVAVTLRCLETMVKQMFAR